MDDNRDEGATCPGSHTTTVLSVREVMQLCNVAQELLAREKNVVRIHAPVTVVGDLHGQLHDLVELLEVGGSTTNYLFLGDFVDRGLHSVETLVLLLRLKVKFPTQITLLRGNHESRQVTQVYGFYDEIIRKYGNADLWVRCTTLFDFLPLAAIVIDSRVFAVHAGLSPELERIEQLDELDRTKDVLSEGIICDMLWSDPLDAEDSRSSSPANSDVNDRRPEKRASSSLSLGNGKVRGGWTVSPRGAGYLFGEDVVNEFNHRNDFKLIARSHQLVMKGFNEVFHGSLTTVWSAPNYMNRCGNSGAILKVSEHDADQERGREYIVFGASPVSQHDDARTLPDYFL